MLQFWTTDSKVALARRLATAEQIICYCACFRSAGNALANCKQLFRWIQGAADQLRSYIQSQSRGAWSFVPSLTSHQYDLLQFQRRKTLHYRLNRPRSGTTSVPPTPSVDSGPHSAPVMTSTLDDVDDAASISSFTSSIGDHDAKSPIRSTDRLQPRPSTANSIFSAPPDPNEDKLISAATQRAKVKFLTLIRSQSSSNLSAASLSGTPMSPMSDNSSTAGHFAVDFDSKAPNRRPAFRHSKTEALLPMSLDLARSIPEGQPTPFDSSKKQRVQSWTDRILYKVRTWYP